jgi:predicted Zn finger-like uncharacterized protein
MKISCQSCQSKYNVADEKVQGKIVKIRCRKCGATIVVNATSSAGANGSVPPPAAPAPQATAARASDAPMAGAAAAAAVAAAPEWHVSVADNDQRTMSLTELVNAYNSGGVAADAYVWTEGMEDWKPLSEVDAVVAALHAAAAAEAPAVAARAFDHAPAPAPAPAPAYEAPSPARTYERTAAYGVGLGAQPVAGSGLGAHTPGGGFGTQAAGVGLAAQVAAAPAAEPKRAAVVKREARARDLFATRTGEEAAVAMAGATDSNMLTGQRNENSVLFSLDHLTKSAEARPMGSASTTTEDSGMIDLKALAAKAESLRPVPLNDIHLGAAPLGVAPAQFAAPIGGYAPIASEAPPKSRLPVLIGAGAGIALLLVLGIVIGLKIGGAVAPTPLPIASASAFPIPSATATADPSAAASASAAASSATPVASTTAKPKGYGGGAFHAGAKAQAGGGGAGAAGGAGGAGASAAGATTGAGGAGGASQGAAPPKKNDCGCNGDLMCMMKCSTH